ncbi:ABC transporter permease subunit [Peribacillus sp. SCS-37]|uniref:ABC transporter permease subunit n=1 Tax=Paraperibacillus esterisolvens TaxID=3115296 RepID=UPI003905E93D
MKFVRILLIYAGSLFGILMISVIPKVIIEKGLFNITGYVEELLKLIPAFIHPGNWIMSYKQASFPILDFIKEPYLYSMFILGSSLLIGLLQALLFTRLSFLLPDIARQFAKKIFTFFSQWLTGLLAGFSVIFVLQKLGVHTGGKPYIFPMLTLSIIPAAVLLGIFLSLEKKGEKPDVKLSIAAFLALIKHRILLNLPYVLAKSRTLLLAAAAGLLGVEVLYVSKGITFYITSSFSPILIAVSLSFIFTPFFILYHGAKIWSDSRNDSFSPEESWKEHLLRAGNTVKIHLANPKFTVGFVFLFGLLVFSICWSVFKEVPIKKAVLLTDGHGKVFSSSPHPPSSYMWFGSDGGGRSIRDQLFVGAKYTILFGLIIALLRVAGGFMLAIQYTFHLKDQTRKFINKVVDSIHFLPLSLIAVILLSPILWDMGGGSWEFSLLERIVLEVVILSLIVIPLTTVLIGSEMRLISHQMYIESARTLGGDNRHILWKHIFPHLAPRLFIIFGQQFIQTLLIFVHLGLFHLFFGGTLVSVSETPDPPRSITFEWSGIMSDAKDAIGYGKYWLVVPALLAFMLCIIAMQLIVQGVKEVQQRKVGVLVPKRIREKQEKTSQQLVPSETSLSLLVKNHMDISG